MSAPPLRAAIDRAKAEVSLEDRRLFLTPEFLCVTFVIVASVCQCAPEREYRVELSH